MPPAKTSDRSFIVSIAPDVKQLARISPELRVVLQLTVIDGLNTREAAALLGIPRGTVKSRLQRARATLREELA